MSTSMNRDRVSVHTPIFGGFNGYPKYGQIDPQMGTPKYGQIDPEIPHFMGIYRNTAVKYERSEWDRVF